LSYHAKDFKTLHAGIAIWKFLSFPVLLVHGEEIDINIVETASIYVLVVHRNIVLKYWYE